MPSLLWRLAQAAIGPQGAGDGKAGAVERVGWAASGLVHAAFAVSAFQSLAGGAGGSRSWVHRVLAWDGGQSLIVLVGIAIIAAGGYQLWKAYTAEFADKLDTARTSPTERTWAVRVGRFGLAARGAVLPIVGYLFVRAGLDANAAQAQGTGGALRELATGPWGSVLLPIVAAGLVAYAAYMGVNARYRRQVMA